MDTTSEPLRSTIHEIGGEYRSLSAEQLLQRLKTTPLGMTSVEARQRLGPRGPNLLRPRKRSGSLILLLSQCRSPITLKPLFAAGLSFFLHDPTDAGIILAYLLAAEAVKRAFYKRIEF